MVINADSTIAAAIDHVVAGDGAGRGVSGSLFGLQHGVERHDEDAAGDCYPK